MKKGVLTRKGARLIKEERVAEFRGEEYSYLHHVWEDVKTHERYTTDELDDLNVNQIYAPYRKKYGIPDETEIAAMKARYGVNNSQLAVILGFGENQIANYLLGEVPSKTNGKVLAAVADVEVFSRYVDNARGVLSARAYGKIRRRIRELQEAEADEYLRGFDKVALANAVRALMKEDEVFVPA